MADEEFTAELSKVLKQFKQTGMRVAYIVNGALVIIGIVVNFFLPHGWVVWPAVLAIGILVMLNEAVDRNGQGLPPLVVYGWFCVALTMWVAAAFVFSMIAPVLLFGGVPLAIIFGVVTWRREKRKEALGDFRRAVGLCVNCGAPVVAAYGACGECGREVDRVDSMLSRIRSRMTGSAPTDVERRREVLTPAPPTVAAMRKERALLARKRRKSS